ncbi:tyrosine-type recombinase/integrase [Fischerella thermalis]|uniref:tyrosine-type recombinase/integrase n=1 Tax=Fischerella thermalis TaxID=372787 RepID=UPI001CA5C57E
MIQKLSGVHQLLIKLLYGTGLRLNEGLSLRVKDVDFALCLNQQSMRLLINLQISQLLISVSNPVINYDSAV